MAFIHSRLETLAKLEHRDDQQQLFVELAERFAAGQELTKEELRGLRTLAEAEEAHAKLLERRQKARQMMSEQAAKARKQRTHEMIQAAGLMALAGLIDGKTGLPKQDKAMLLGALVELAERKPTELEKLAWQQVGQKLLEKGEP